MKIKKVICLLLTICVLGHSSLTFASEEIPLITNGEEALETDLLAEEPESIAEPVSVPPADDATIKLDGFCSADADGNISIPESGIFDFLFPEEIKGELVYRIGPGAFQGCEFFRIVAIPASVTEIGENAFADCANLERIILLGRSDDKDMLLGENWSGDAEVVFDLPSEVQEETEVLVEEEEKTDEESQEENISSETPLEENTAAPEESIQQDIGVTPEPSEGSEESTEENQEETPPVPDSSQDEEIPSESDLETEPPASDALPKEQVEVTEESSDETSEATAEAVPEITSE